MLKLVVIEVKKKRKNYPLLNFTIPGNSTGTIKLTLQAQVAAADRD